MKYIISTTGEKIKFSINRQRNLTIDPIIPVEVSFIEYELLKIRLGHQIRHVDPLTGSDPVIEQEISETVPEKNVEEIPVIEQPISPVILTHADEETITNESVETTEDSKITA